MNPYAAQLVLGVLKKPEKGQEQEQEQQSTTSRPWGLRAFVQMSREERGTLFADWLGKSAVERVSRVLDAEWGDGSGGGCDSDGAMVDQGEEIDVEIAVAVSGSGSGNTSEEAMLID